MKIPRLARRAESRPRSGTFLIASLATVVAVLVSACGRYGQPLPPESFSPAPVQSLEVVPAADGITLKWEAPNDDRRGKELKSLDGYRVYRTELSTEKTKKKAPGEDEPEATDDEPYGEVADGHIAVRDQLRRDARAQGKIGRRVDVPAESKKFEFKDTALIEGKSYAYRIVPVNQGGVEGALKKAIRVRYLGAESEVSIVDAEDDDASDLVAEPTNGGVFEMGR